MDVQEVLDNLKEQNANTPSSILDPRSLNLRRLVVDALQSAGKGHFGSSMSLIEMLRVLYDNYLNYRPHEPTWPIRDRLILSKGHGCLALYALLADKGFFPKQNLLTFCQPTSILGGHPEYGKVPGVEASTGSLGHGLSIGVGLALAARIQKKQYRVVVIMGDGEINEGSVWEAVLACAKHRLSNLTVFIDYNKIQCYGATKKVLNLEPILDKWVSFGFATMEVDGHDVNQLKKVVDQLPLLPDKPTVVICHTIKGKGFPFAENNPNWHYKHELSKMDLEKIYECI